MPQAVEQSDSQKKVISIALAGILVIAGAVGIISIRCFQRRGCRLVGQWVDNSGHVRVSIAMERLFPIHGLRKYPYLYWPFESSWTKSGDEVTTTYERTVTSGEFHYDEKSNAVMKMKIDGVMFLAIAEGVLIEDYGDGEVYEYDLTNLVNPVLQWSIKADLILVEITGIKMLTILGIQWLTQLTSRVGAIMN